MMHSQENGNEESLKNWFCHLSSTDVKQDVILDSRISPQLAGLLYDNEKCFNNEVKSKEVIEKMASIQIIQKIKTNLEEAQEVFGKLDSTRVKRAVVLDHQISPQEADLLLSNDFAVDNVDVLDENVIEKVNKACDDYCQELKNKTIAKIEEIAKTSDKAFEEEQSQLKKNLKIVEDTFKVIEKIGTLASKLADKPMNPGKVKEDLQSQMKMALDKGYIDKSRYDEMKSKVDGTSRYDPGSVKEVAEKTKYNLSAKKSEIKKIQNENANKRIKLKNYWKKMKSGIKGLSTSEKIDKSFTAISHVGTAIGKFMGASNSSLTGSQRALTITSGILDITNAISTFLPPPASLITSTVSGILNMFGLGGGGGPSNEKVIDEVKKGFEEQKNFIQEEFQKQKEFIEKKFMEQAGLIKDEFAKNQRIEFEEFVQDMNIFASSLLEEISERFTFIQGFGSVDLNDNEAGKINDIVDILDNTQEVARIRLFIKQKCLPELIRCDNHDMKVPCLLMIYTLVTIEKQRDITLLTIINILQSTNFRNLNAGYLRVQAKRKEINKKWLRDVLLDQRVGCIITNQWLSNSWKPQSAQDEVLDFMSYIDPSLSTALRSFKSGNASTYCQQLNSGVWWTGKTCEGMR